MQDNVSNVNSVSYSLLKSSSLMLLDFCVHKAVAVLVLYSGAFVEVLESFTFC